MNPLETRALYDLSHTLAAPLLEKVRYPWEALSGIGAFIAALGPTLSQEEYASPRPGVWIHKTADRKSTRLNSSHPNPSRMPSSA